MVVFEDERVLVLNKPSGMAVQGGSGIGQHSHLDGILSALNKNEGACTPKVVHRIDRDVTGIPPQPDPSHKKKCTHRSGIVRQNC